MNHKERLELSKKISKNLMKKYGKDIISIGIFGSVARNEDNNFSDLELIVITRKSEFFNHYIYGDIAVLEIGMPLKKAMGMIRNLNGEWPLNLSKLVCQKVIFGDRSIPAKFRKEIRRLKKKDFDEAAKKYVSWMYEYICKIRNAVKAKSFEKLFVPLAIYTIKLNLFVGLLNRHIYSRQYFDALKEAKTLRRLPKDYHKLMMILYKAKNLKHVESAAEQLYKNCLNLLQSND